MDSKDIWDNICIDMKENNFQPENILQIIVGSCLKQMDWHSSQIRKPTIQLGAANHGIPDIVLYLDQIQQICIEIKRANINFDSRHIQQLQSYMRQLKLRYGILWGQTIRVYCDDDINIKLVCEIDFDKNNELGIKLVDVLNRKSFSLDNFEEFCIEQIKAKEKIEEDKHILNFLCSDKGIKEIKEYLSTKYSNEILDKIDIIVKNKTTNHISISHNSVAPTIITSSSNLSIQENETFQNWIKRILKEFYDNGILTQDEINNMHDLQYSKNTFGIQYSLLVDTFEETFDNTGRSRYWQKWKLGPYYVCSQWWEDKFDLYKDKINLWINRVNK